MDVLGTREKSTAESIKRSSYARESLGLKLNFCSLSRVNTGDPALRWTKFYVVDFDGNELYLTNSEINSTVAEIPYLRPQ